MEERKEHRNETFSTLYMAALRTEKIKAAIVNELNGIGVKSHFHNSHIP